MIRSNPRLKGRLLGIEGQRYLRVNSASERFSIIFSSIQDHSRHIFNTFCLRNRHGQSVRFNMAPPAIAVQVDIAAEVLEKEDNAENEECEGDSNHEH